MRHPIASTTSRCLLALALICLGASAAWAGGAQDSSLQQADKYVQEKKYDEALNVLADIIARDPSRMDEAQAKINEIIKIKDNYNSLLREFIDVLRNDPGNYERTLEIIGKMRDKNPNPTAEQRADIEKYRITAKLTSDRFKKDQIMADALAQIQQRQFSAAIDTYLAGFSLQAEDFALGTQTEEFKATVLGRTREVRQAVTTLKSENTALQPVLESFVASIREGKDGLDRLSARFPGFASQFLKAVAQTTALEQAAEDMTPLRQRSDREYPPSNPNFDYNEYIRFVQEFMQGPSGKTGQGIRYAARSLIDSEYADTLSGLQALYAERKSEFASMVQAGQDTTEGLRLILLSGSILMRAQALQGNTDIGANPSFADLASKLPAVYRAAPAQVLGELKTYQLYQSDSALAVTLKRLQASQAPGVWQEALAAWDSGQAAFATWEREIQLGLASRLVDAAQNQRLRAIFGSLHDSTQNGLLGLARERYAAIAASQLAQIRALFAAQSADDQRAVLLLSGVASTNPATLPNEALKAGIYRFPEQAQALFGAVKGRLLSQLGALDILDKDIAALRKEISAFRAVQLSAEGSQALRREIQASIARLDANTAKSQAAVRAAQDDLQKASQALGQADAAISASRLDVDTADARYNDARELFFNSFDKSYSADQRLAADNRLKDLLARIEKARNDLLTKRISELLAQIATQFNNENYNQAGDLIAEAEGLDNQTAFYKNAIIGGAKPDEARDPQIKYWKNRVAAASTLSTERSLSETDPDFAIIANYLNLARIDFNQISKLVAGGKRNDAATKDLVRRALQNIGNVLLVKPNNWDAKLLRLRILQVADRESFDKLFPNRVDDAVAAGRKDPNFNALTELLALQELSPRYPGLAAAIFELKVKLGLEKSPAEKAKVAEASRLVNLAAQKVGSKNQAELQLAIQQLNQAFALDPDNTRINPLLSQARQGLRAVEASLSYEEDIRLREAQNLFNSGNVASAKIIVDELLPKHPTIAALVKLNNQINQELGQ